MRSTKTEKAVISIDGACSGKRCACAAVLVRDGRVIAERSRSLPEVDGYVLAAEIAAVALAAQLVESGGQVVAAMIETDNPDVPRVVEQGYRLKQVERIPGGLVVAAVEFARTHQLRFERLARNSTVGLRHAHCLASRRLGSRRAPARSDLLDAIRSSGRGRQRMSVAPAWSCSAVSAQENGASDEGVCQGIHVRQLGLHELRDRRT
jgi:hypothetical protein